MLDAEALFTALRMVLQGAITEAPTLQVAAIILDHPDHAVGAERVEAKCACEHQNRLSGNDRLRRMQKLYPPNVKHLPFAERGKGTLEGARALSQPNAVAVQVVPIRE